MLSLLSHFRAKWERNQNNLLQKIKRNFEHQGQNTFKFAPKIVIVRANSYRELPYGVVLISAQNVGLSDGVGGVTYSGAITFSNNFSVYVSWNGVKIQFYNTENQWAQLNYTGNKYFYCALA